jgi:hypothetical protein
MHSSVPIISVLVGCALLFCGRRLFWLFVAALGFAIGLELAPYLSQHPPLWLSLLLSIALGLVGMLLAIMLQKLAIGIAGFLVGGRVAIAVAAAVWVNYAHYSIVTFVLGGIVGAILLLALFDWALIIFSAIEGARLITQNVHLPSAGATVLVVGLAVFGIFVQATMFRGGRRG